MALLGPLTRLLEVATRPSRTATHHLASAQVSRHLSVYAVPVVLTVLAVGATTLAALYALFMMFGAFIPASAATSGSPAVARTRLVPRNASCAPTSCGPRRHGRPAPWPILPPT